VTHSPYARAPDLSVTLSRTAGQYLTLFFHQHTEAKDVITSKGKAVPLQAWSGLEVSRKLRFPDIMKTAQDGGKDVSLTHRPPLPPGNTPGTHFC
jgi:hypothetical protein